MLIVGSRYTKGSQPIYLHPISIFFSFLFSWQYEPHRRACCSPRMENLLLHIWNVQIDCNDNLHCWKIYITRRRGICYIIIFLQSFSYLHTALLQWRLTTDSISENGGDSFPLPGSTADIFHTLCSCSSSETINVLLRIIYIWFLFLQ